METLVSTLARRPNYMISNILNIQGVQILHSVSVLIFGPGVLRWALNSTEI